MKCEVCGTKIPLGTNECPNCGYKWKDDHVNTFDISSNTHEHIQTQKVNQYYQPNKSRRTITIVVIIFILALIIPLLVNRFIMNNEVIFDFGNQDHQSFQELIDQGYDEDGTIRKAIDDSQSVESYLRDELKLSQVEMSQDSYINDNDTIRYSFEVTGNQGGIYCGIKYSYEQGKLESKNFFLLGDSNQEISDGELLPQQISLIKSFGQFVGDNDVLSKVKQACQAMTKSEYDESENSFSDYVDDVHVYLTENDNGESSYHYYISVTLSRDKGV